MKLTHRALALLLTLILIALPLTSCGGGSDTDTVAVSIPPEAAFVHAVAGDDFNVVTLVPPGYSPEAYEPTVRTMMAFADATLFFSIGVPVDEATLIPALSDKTRHVALNEVAASVYSELTIDGGRDPHVWLSPKRVKVMVTAIAEELAFLRPDRAEVYRQNAAAYCASLDAADARIRTALDASGVREFIVYHPAFGYLADEYGLTMYALEEHGSEATATDLAEMIDFARDRGIKVIFYQAETDGRQAEAFAAEVGGSAVMLSPLSEEYIQNLEAMADAIVSASKGE